MSGLQPIYLLSDYKIDENEPKMISQINYIKSLEEKGQYYFAFHALEELIMQDGTNEKYNYKFLNMILDYYDKILEQIKKIDQNIQLNEEEDDKEKKAQIDAKNYNFFYFRDCFDKYEVSLNNKQINIIYNKKKKYNKKVIEKYPYLNEDYTKLINNIENPVNKILADEIFDKIEYLNLKITDDNNYKLLYIYKFLDIDLIENNKVFEYLEKDIYYLNQFSFGYFNKLGIPIGYSNNSNLEYRYLFLLIKNKIKENIKQYENDNIEEDNNNKIEKNNKKLEDNNELQENYNKMQEREEPIKFVFKTFKFIFSNIKTNRLEFFKYFAFIFLNIIFEGENDISDIYNDEMTLLQSYFQILCEQFSITSQINESLSSYYEKVKNKKIEFEENQYKINFKNKQIILNNKEYSINSFIINLNRLNKKNEILLLNNSKKFLCKEKIFGKYYDDFINLLKKICRSNIAQIMQASHEEFKEFISFYSRDEIMNDLFNKRLKFFPYECNNIYGITDKYLMEIYMSSIYMNNIKGFTKNLDDFFEEILYTFNMAFDSVVFQHESLNHYVRGYLFYYNDDKRKISIDTKSDHIYYPKQKLDEIKEKPNYLNKFLFKLEKKDLDELEKISNLNYKKYLEEYTEKDNQDIKMPNMKKKIDEKEKNKENEFDKKEENHAKEDDEGYYYERQLFTLPNETKLKKFNFLQALMLIDEDAYNLDPIHFHYCFLQLQDTKKFSFIKENFKSQLLVTLLEKIDQKFQKEIKNLTFISKRSLDGGLYFYAERSGYDVMSSYAKI